MKRLNPETNRPFRCGDVHPDTGLIFRGYNKQRLKRDGFFVELWLMPDSFNAIKARMRERARVRRERDAYRRLRTSEQIIAALG